MHWSWRNFSKHWLHMLGLHVDRPMELLKCRLYSCSTGQPAYLTWYQCPGKSSGLTPSYWLLGACTAAKWDFMCYRWLLIRYDRDLSESGLQRSSNRVINVYAAKFISACSISIIHQQCYYMQATNLMSKNITTRRNFTQHPFDLASALTSITSNYTWLINDWYPKASIIHCSLLKGYVLWRS